MIRTCCRLRRDGVIGRRDGFRRPSHHRRRLAHRIAEAHRAASRGSCATSASPRIWRTTRSSRRSSSGRRTAFHANPGAWLMATAKHRAIDHWRRSAASATSTRRSATSSTPTNGGSRPRHGAGRRRGRRPAAADLHSLPSGAFDGGARRPDAAAARRPHDDEIARAFLVPEPTIAQRIVRAKKTLAKARVPFEVPRGADRGRGSRRSRGHLPRFQRRLRGHGRRGLVRPALCEEALRLGACLPGSRRRSPRCTVWWR